MKAGKREWSLTRVGGRRDVDPVAMADFTEWVKATLKLGHAVRIEIDSWGKAVGKVEGEA